jgi:hypothetical protein
MGQYTWKGHYSSILQWKGSGQAISIQEGAMILSKQAAILIILTLHKWGDLSECSKPAIV